MAAKAPALEEPWVLAAAPSSDCACFTVTTFPKIFLFPWAEYYSINSPITDDGVIGYMEATSITLYTIIAAAVFPSRHNYVVIEVNNHSVCLNFLLKKCFHWDSNPGPGQRE